MKFYPSLYTVSLITQMFTFDKFDEKNVSIGSGKTYVGADGKMAITDTQYFRVLLWHDWQTALTQRADVIIGQKDLNGNGANQFRLSPEANTLNWCYDTQFYKNGIFVADSGNSRILWFDNTPSVSDAFADNLIGKSHFNMGSENADTVFGTEKTLYWPFAISIENDTLVLADTGNHRIVFYTLIF